ncbi:MAG: GAF domain-containing protein [Verrucomicrobia bacterium]|nr:GAF domain-containing protein [Verrucomicrobiota bacterium]
MPTTSPDRIAELPLFADLSSALMAYGATSDTAHFLQDVAERVAAHFQTALCSIYLYEVASNELVLAASVGLNAASVGEIRTRYGEGIIGIALRDLQVIAESHASHDPGSCQLVDDAEALYDSFLAVPIYLESERIGVLVVRREAQKDFSETEILLIQIFAAELAGAIGGLTRSHPIAG